MKKDSRFWAFDRDLTTSRPNIGDRERLHQYLDEILDRRWLTNDGPVLREFEHELGSYLNVDHAVCVCNGTVGLQLAVVALSRGLRGCEYICPSFTFIATPHALQWVGMKPVFCDVNSETHNLDPERVEELVTEHTVGILAVHMWGNPCYPDALEDIAHCHNLALIFDAAHAFGVGGDGLRVGSYGHYEVFSLHATKWLNSFEGGVITTNNVILANRIRQMRNFGFSDYHSTSYLGTNGKMSEIHAAMGLVSLSAESEFRGRLRENYLTYRANLSNVPGIRLMEHDEGSNYQYIVVEILPECKMTRDSLADALLVRNIMARRYFSPPCHECQPYVRMHTSVDDRLPVTNRLSASLLNLPTGTALSTGDVEAVCDIIKELLT